MLVSAREAVVPRCGEQLRRAVESGFVRASHGRRYVITSARTGQQQRQRGDRDPPHCGQECSRRRPRARHPVVPMRLRDLGRVPVVSRFVPETWLVSRRSDNLSTIALAIVLGRGCRSDVRQKTYSRRIDIHQERENLSWVDRGGLAVTSSCWWCDAASARRPGSARRASRRCQAKECR